MSASWKPNPSRLLAACLIISASTTFAQSTPPTPQQLQDSLQKLSTELTAAQERLQQSQLEIQRLQQQLLDIQAQLPKPSTPLAAPAPVVATTPADTTEKVDILQAEVKQHDQTKIESVSKYPVRFTGLILFNTFINKGAVDNIDLPSVAFRPTPGVSDLTTGISVRQTILGVQATGPRIFGAHSYGDVNFDFYGGTPYSNYGTVTGQVRLRTAALRLNWEHDTAEIGFVEPLISPLSPTSYATVAEPAMAWAGNLWTWAPQASYEHRFAETSKGHVALQLGLWDPPAPGYNTDGLARSPSAGERSGQLAYETRLSLANKDAEHGLQLGLSGYYSRQSYTGRAGDSWAVTTDWRLPIHNIFELSGEAYRGRALGGLGGGVYKDIVNGTDPVTGAATFNLLNTVGGWTQAKFRANRTLEGNAIFGLDNGFASDFHSLVLIPGASNTQLRARNNMTTFNLIFSPKTYLILSPEYRHIWTWPINGIRNTANVYTLSFGLRF